MVNSYLRNHKKNVFHLSWVALSINLVNSKVIIVDVAISQSISRSNFTGQTIQGGIYSRRKPVVSVTQGLPGAKEAYQFHAGGTVNHMVHILLIEYTHNGQIELSNSRNLSLLRTIGYQTFAQLQGFVGIDIYLMFQIFLGLMAYIGTLIYVIMGWSLIPIYIIFLTFSSYEKVLFYVNLDPSIFLVSTFSDYMFWCRQTEKLFYKIA